MRDLTASILLTIGILRPLPLQGQATPTLLVGGESNYHASLAVPVRAAYTDSLLFLLNATPPFLQVFDWSGTVRQTLGRAGGGPGEFAEPSALAVDAKGRQLFVIDPRAGRITTYAIRDTLTFRRSEVLPLWVRDACVLDGELLVVSDYHDRLLHRLTRTDSGWVVSASWATPRTAHPLRDHPAVRMMASEGPIGCPTHGDTVYVASGQLGEVQVLSLRDSSQTSVMIAPFTPVTLSLVPHDRVPGLRFTMPPGGVIQQVVRILVSPDGPLVLLGSVDRDHRGRGDYGAFQVRRLAGIADTSAHTFGLVGWHNGRAVCLTTDPAPAVALGTAGSCP